VIAIQQAKMGRKEIAALNANNKALKSSEEPTTEPLINPK